MANQHVSRRSAPALRAVLACVSVLVGCGIARAQGTGLEIRGRIDDVPKLQDLPFSLNPFDTQTTVLPRREGPKEGEAQPPADGGTGRLSLEAVLVEDGQTIGEDLVWRVFASTRGSGAAPQLLRTITETAPNLVLPAGTYYVNVAFGRANLTKRVTLLARSVLKEQFVLNAGGLRATVEIAGGLPPLPQNVAINIYSDEADQSGQRMRVIADARPGQIIRLNSGLYHIESLIEGGNAVVRSEVSVEAGKLTQVAIVHEAAVISFKLVSAPGGEAIAGTQWAILGPGGNIVQESVGALPRHVLAPGRYTVSAAIGGQRYRRDFQVLSGRNADVEVLAQ